MDDAITQRPNINYNRVRSRLTSIKCDHAKDNSFCSVNRGIIHKPESVDCENIRCYGIVSHQELPNKNQISSTSILTYSVGAAAFGDEGKYKDSTHDFGPPLYVEKEVRKSMSYRRIRDLLRAEARIMEEELMLAMFNKLSREMRNSDEEIFVFRTGRNSLTDVKENLRSQEERVKGDWRDALEITRDNNVWLIGIRTDLDYLLSKAFAPLLKDINFVNSNDNRVLITSASIALSCMDESERTGLFRESEEDSKFSFYCKPEKEDSYDIPCIDISPRKPKEGFETKIEEIDEIADKVMYILSGLGLVTKEGIPARKMAGLNKLLPLEIMKAYDVLSPEMFGEEGKSKLGILYERWME